MKLEQVLRIVWKLVFVTVRARGMESAVKNVRMSSTGEWLAGVDSVPVLVWPGGDCSDDR